MTSTIEPGAVSPNSAAAPTPAPVARWMRVGHASGDARTAAQEALATAVRGTAPVLVLAFCKTGFDFRSALTALEEQVVPRGGVVAGCTSFGQFALDEGRALLGDDVDSGIVVVAFGGDGFSVKTRLVTDVSLDRRRAGEQAAAVAGEPGEDSQTLCLFLADGLTRDHDEIVRGAYSWLGAGVPVVGGCAGDDLHYASTHQFLATADGTHVVTDALIALAITTTGRIGVGIEHGWTKVDRPMLVSRSVGGEIFELDHRPALDVYLERLGAPRSLALDEAAFTEAAFGAPLGLSRRSGEDIRVVHAADVTRGSLICLAEVPQGAIAWQMTSTPASLTAAANASCSTALANADTDKPAGVVMFNCGARKAQLGETGVAAELATLASATAGPCAGFYTFGEIARTVGARGMHHLTVVSVAFS